MSLHFFVFFLVADMMPHRYLIAWWNLSLCIKSGDAFVTTAVMAMHGEDWEVSARRYVIPSDVIIILVLVKGQLSDSGDRVKGEETANYFTVRAHCSIGLSIWLATDWADVLSGVWADPAVQALHSVKALLWVLLFAHAYEYVIRRVEDIKRHFPVMFAWIEACCAQHRLVIMCAWLTYHGLVFIRELHVCTTVECVPFPSS